MYYIIDRDVKSPYTYASVVLGLDALLGGQRNLVLDAAHVCNNTN